MSQANDGGQGQTSKLITFEDGVVTLAGEEVPVLCAWTAKSASTNKRWMVLPARRKLRRALRTAIS